MIPAGDYAMSTWVTLKSGKGVAIKLDGVIYRTGTAGGNMIFIENTSDFEMFSSTGKGAVQGMWSGKRLLRKTMRLIEGQAMDIKFMRKAADPARAFYACTR